MNNPKFKITKENQEKLSLEDVKFSFEQAEKLLKKSADISSIVVTRTVILLSVAIGILLSIIGFLLKQHIDLKYFGIVEFVGEGISIYLFIWVLLTVQNIKGTGYDDIGSQPKDLIHDHYILTYPDDKDKRLIYYYLSQVDDYQDRIDKNYGINDKRWKQFRLSLWGIVSIPFLAVILFALLE